jgi:hypothetical protein
MQILDMLLMLQQILFQLLFFSFYKDSNKYNISKKILAPPAGVEPAVIGVKVRYVSHYTRGEYFAQSTEFRYLLQLFYLLSRQESNLHSIDSESSMLAITPRDNLFRILAYFYSVFWHFIISRNSVINQFITHFLILP